MNIHTVKSSSALLPGADADTRILTLNLFNLQEKFAELSKQSGEASFGKVDSSELERENELLLSQLFQAQSAIENYHNLCEQMITTLSSAEHSLERAQALLVRLTNLKNKNMASLD